MASKKKPWTGERLETTIYEETTIEHLHRYACAMELTKGKKVLDIACGDGYGSNLIAKEATEVCGVDIDAPVIAEAKEKYKQKNLSFINGSIENIPFPSLSFDIVVCFETIEHIDDHEKGIAEIKRVMKPDGTLIISTPEKRNYTDIPGNSNPFHKKELTEPEFINLLSKHFKIITLSYQNFLSTSVITKTDPDIFKYYKGNFNEIVAATSIEPLYLIAVCSDSKKAELSSSLFLSKPLIGKALTVREEEVRSTITYRIGHAILFPFKLIRHLIFKSPVK